jgi:hypothetical protein
MSTTPDRGGSRLARTARRRTAQSNLAGDDGTPAMGCTRSGPPSWRAMAVLVGWVFAHSMLAQAPPADVVADITVEPFPADAVNLMPNAGLEEPNADGDGPAHWQKADNLVYHWTTDPQAPDRGKVIHINTDVQQRQAYAWWIQRYLHGASIGAAPAWKPTQPPKYDTIAGLDGGFYWSGYIPVKPGGAYRVYVDAKGPKAKVFIRGYVKQEPISFADEQPAVQQVFRKARGDAEVTPDGRPVRYRLRYKSQTWFAVGGSDDWQTCTHIMPRHPNGRELTEDVRYIRIMLYPYWPPGDYWFDNIRVVEVSPAAAHGRPEAEEADLEEGKVVR